MLRKKGCDSLKWCKKRLKISTGFWTALFKDLADQVSMLIQLTLGRRIEVNFVCLVFPFLGAWMNEQKSK